MNMLSVSDAPFALKVVQRKDGTVADIYRRRPDKRGKDRLQRIGTISPLAFTAATPLLREGIACSRFQEATNTGRRMQIAPLAELADGTFQPLDGDWGPRIACYALVTAGLRDFERLFRAANHLRYADANEAAWWLGHLSRNGSSRSLRALRILTEAVA